jgi:glycosyltransferase involved in cell wall biosynthesis
LQKQKPDCVIAHGNRAIKFCHYANLKRQYKIIGAAHNYNYKWFYKCDDIFSITQHLADFLVSKKIPKDKIHILGNTLKITEPTPERPIKHIDEHITIGTLSRLVPQKGIEVFLKAIALLQKQGLTFNVIIGGDGDLKNSLIQLANDLKLQNLNFIGWVEDKDTFFKKLDIFCLPSLHEPFGIVVLEAMMYGAPIVSTKSEGPNEIISDGQNGVLCNLNDEIDLAGKIAFLMQNPELAKKIRDNAYSYVTNTFGEQIIQTKLNNYLTQICST